MKNLLLVSILIFSSTLLYAGVQTESLTVGTNTITNFNQISSSGPTSTVDLLKLSNDVVSVSNQVTNAQAQLIIETNRAYTVETNLQAQINIVSNMTGNTVSLTKLSNDVASVSNNVNTETNRAYVVETNLQAQINIVSNMIPGSISLTKLSNDVDSISNQVTNAQAQLIIETNRAYVVETNLQAQINIVSNNTPRLNENNNFSGTNTFSNLYGNAYGITNAPHNSGFNSPTDVIITFTNSTRTFYLTPSASQYQLAIYSRWITITNPLSTILPDIEGAHFIYVDGGGNLTNSLAVWPIGGEAQVSIVYWDSTNQIASMIADERHGNMMDDSTHKYLHSTIGTKWVSGGTLISSALASGSPNANGSNTVVSITSVSLADEDLPFSITTNNQNLGNQSTLSSSNDAAKLPVLYATGLVNNLQWRLTTPEVWPFTYNNTTATYNQLVSSTWTLTPVPEDNYYAIWIFGTDTITNGIISIPHHTVYPTLAGILTGAAPETIFVNRTTPILPEMKLLYRLIYLFNAVVPGQYSQAVKCSRLTYVTDYRTDNTRPINATPAQSHGALTGLANDDHLQYLPVDGSRNPNNGVYPILTTDQGAVPTPLVSAPTTTIYRTNGMNLVLDCTNNIFLTYYTNDLINTEIYRFRLDMRLGTNSLTWDTNYFNATNILSIQTNIFDVFIGIRSYGGGTFEVR